MNTGLRRAGVAAVSACTLLGAGVPAAQAAEPWHRYVLGPKSERVTPVRIHSTEGRVTNPQRLLGRGAGVTTLTMTEGGQQPAIVLDYGKVVGGIPFLEVQSVEGSPTIRASFSESGRYIDEDGDNGGEGPCCGNAPPAAEPKRWNEWTPTGPTVLRTAFQQGGERFERIALTSPGVVRLRRVGIDVEFFRATPREYEGWFLSSDRALNEVWYAAAYTDQLNMVPPGTQNDNEAPRVVDGAKRDRLQWSGDTIVEGPSIWNHLGQTGAEYVKGTLRDFTPAPPPVPPLPPGTPPSGALLTTVGIGAGARLVFSATYSMHAANAKVDYYRYTGDEAWAQEILPQVRGQLGFNESLLGEDGLIVTGPPGSRPDVGFPPLCCGLDWDPYDGPKVGEIAAYNIVYFHTLQQAAYVEEHAGDPARATELREQAQALRGRINAAFYDEEVGLYRLGVGKAGHAQDASVFAILFGVAPEDQVDDILQGLQETLWTEFGPHPFTAATGFEDYDKISPFITGFETQARLAVGDTAGGFDLIRRHFGQMLERNLDYSGALWEKMAPDGSADELTDPTLPIDGNSLAHGWATSPLTALSEHVLGVSPIDPGYATFRVAPHLGELGWARGAVPTPRGPVLVEVNRNAAGSYARLVLTVPKGTTAIVTPPPLTGPPTRLTLDGRVVPTSEPITIEGGPRKHKVAVSSDD